jgi:hypothetical protein
MQAPYQLKEQELTDTPLVLFDCALPDGEEEHWCTHTITLGTTNYDARVLQHSSFDIQTASDQGIDGSPKIVVTLANADSHFSEIEQSTGFKGAQLTVSFIFYDLRNNASLTDPIVVFQGICNPPDQIKEATFRLSAGNRMNLQRLTVPPVHIQRRCPWNFPSTLAERTEAVNGGANGQYSQFYNCGYSADITGGTGLLNGGAPFTSCGYVRADCQARGMWSRFGGIEFVPAVISVRSYGQGSMTSNVSVNQARYNDYVPMVYGTAWYYPPVVFARNDGNLTRMEVLLGMGQMQGVLTVLVSGYEIPLGISGKNMTATGWYNVVTLGTRDGGFDLNFTDANGNPLGDAYGSMAYLSVVVPNAISNGLSLPTVQVLAQGIQVPTYGSDGTFQSNQFSSNPAWILLDVLRRCGWTASEIDYTSFAATAAYCDQQINSTDLNGNPIQIPRFQVNVVLQNKRSGGDFVRGIRNAARLYLTYGPGGILQLQVENTIALQQPNQLSNSNSTEQLNGGWPSYEFGDGSTTGFSSILRLPTGEPSITLTSRSIADTPNDLTVEFQDALNSYQQDSYDLFDSDDIQLVGQEVSATLMALGLPNYDQAARILQFNLDKSVRGNQYIQFQTSVRALGIRPGDIITVTYLKEGLERQPFRVQKISPATNYRTATISAQIHDDAWYADSNGQTNSAAGNTYAGSSGVGVPKPLLGNTLDDNGDIEFGISEVGVTNTDGSVEEDVIVNFVVPTVPSAPGPPAPLVSLACTVGTGGSLQGGQTLYYGISGQDSAGNEGVLSFLVTAVIVNSDSTVTLSSLSFPPGTSTFNVYRGTTTANIYRIATAQALAAQFVDTGFSDQLIAPADPFFDHANFYWRMEQQPEIGATIFSATTIGNGTLAMAANGYQGMTARITRGTGAGDERTILGNDATVLTVSPSWDVTPDATSFFVVAEAGWHFAAQTKSSPVQFAIPNQAGEVVEITGRSANVNDVESSAQLAVVTRWQIGGSGTSDAAVPPAPLFGMSPPGPGTIGLSGIGFSDLTNTRTVSAATFTVYFWDELQPAPTQTLASNVAITDQAVTLSSAGSAVPNTMLLIDSEVMQVTAINNNGLQYQVTRAADGSIAAAHNAGALIYQLTAKTVVTSFPNEFFGSPYSGNWIYSWPLPDVRVASAELFVTNRLGNSPTTGMCYTSTADNGLRTLSGGQYSIQVQGYLFVAQNAAPALIVDSSHAVRDVYAVLGQAADAPVQLQVNVNGAQYCQLTVAKGQVTSNTVLGNALPPLIAGTQITLSILAVGQTYPGSDLTVLIRL